MGILLAGETPSTRRTRSRTPTTLGRRHPRGRRRFGNMWGDRDTEAKSLLREAHVKGRLVALLVRRGQ
jgi:hypothetical protein